MTIYGGLDVSDKRTHICVIDGIAVTVPKLPPLTPPWRTSTHPRPAKNNFRTGITVTGAITPQ